MYTSVQKDERGETFPNMVSRKDETSNVELSRARGAYFASIIHSMCDLEKCPINMKTYVEINLSTCRKYCNIEAEIKCAKCFKMQAN